MLITAAHAQFAPPRPSTRCIVVGGMWYDRVRVTVWLSRRQLARIATTSVNKFPESKVDIRVVRLSHWTRMWTAGVRTAMG